MNDTRSRLKIREKDSLFFGLCCWREMRGFRENSGEVVRLCWSVILSFWVCWRYFLGSRNAHTGQTPMWTRVALAGDKMVVVNDKHRVGFCPPGSLLRTINGPKACEACYRDTIYFYFYFSMAGHGPIPKNHISEKCHFSSSVGYYILRILLFFINILKLTYYI